MQYCENFDYVVIDCITKKVKIPSAVYTIANEGDYNCGELHFMILNRSPRIKPEHCAIKVTYTNAKGETGYEYLEPDQIVFDKKTILITMPIPYSLVVRRGKVKIGLSIISETYKWNISAMKFNVGFFNEGCGCNTQYSDPQLEMIDSIAIRVKRLEEADFEIPLEFIKKKHLSPALKEEMVWDTDLKEVTDEEVEDMWVSY